MVSCHSAGALMVTVAGLYWQNPHMTGIATPFRACLRAFCVVIVPAKCGEVYVSGGPVCELVTLAPSPVALSSRMCVVG